jgi:hypothetical protein
MLATDPKGQITIRTQCRTASQKLRTGHGIVAGPISPEKVAEHSSSSSLMPALGHQRTLRCVRVTSALTAKADIGYVGGASANSGGVPTSAKLFVLGWPA